MSRRKRRRRSSESHRNKRKRRRKKYCSKNFRGRKLSRHLTCGISSQALTIICCCNTPPLLEGFFSSFYDFALSAAAAAAYHLGFLKDFSRPFNECSAASIGFEIWSKPVLFLTHR
jgi:hypothetical protein